MMMIENKYEIGQRLYLSTDPEQLERVVTGIFIRPGGNLIYEVACGSEISEHYDFEMSAEENQVIKMK